MAQPSHMLTNQVVSPRDTETIVETMLGTLLGLEFTCVHLLCSGFITEILPLHLEFPQGGFSPYSETTCTDAMQKMYPMGYRIVISEHHCLFRLCQLISTIVFLGLNQQTNHVTATYKLYS